MKKIFGQFGWKQEKHTQDAHLGLLQGSRKMVLWEVVWFPEVDSLVKKALDNLKLRSRERYVRYTFAQIHVRQRATLPRIKPYGVFEQTKSSFRKKAKHLFQTILE